MNKFIKAVAFNIALFVSIPTAYGMEPIKDNDQALESGDFTQLPDETLQHILEYLCKRLPDASLLDAFKDNLKLARFGTNRIRLNHFGLTCKRLNHLINPYIFANRTMLNNLLLNTLDYNTMVGNKKNARFCGEETDMRVGACLSAGADVNCSNKYHETPLMLAIQNCPQDYETIHMLLKNGANANQKGILNKGILNKCCFNIVELLIEHGADVNQTNKYGETPLYDSILKVEDRHYYNDFTWKHAQEDCQKIAQLLIQHGADVNRANENGETPLYHAVCNDRIEIVRLLIEHGVNVNQSIKNRETPLYASAYPGIFNCYHNKTIMELLIKHGAHVDHAVNLVNTLGSNSWRKPEEIIPQIMEVNARVKKHQENDSTILSNHDNDNNFSSTPVVVDSAPESNSASDSIRNPQDVLREMDDSSSSSESAVIEILQPAISEPAFNNTSNPDDDFSSSSESDSIDLPQPTIPEIPIPGPTLGGTPPNNLDSGMFTTVLHSIRANPLPIMVGFVGVGGICYWAYNKYKAYKASKEQVEQDEQNENNEAVADQVVEQPATA